MGKREELIRRAKEVLSDDVAIEIAKSYGDGVVFPSVIEIDRANAADRLFIDWPDDVLVLARENQGVCTWGMSLGEETIGIVVVGGDLPERATVAYCVDLNAYVEARRWDGALFGGTPLLQAQTPRLEAETRELLGERFDERASTQAWPSAENLRFERAGLRVMLCLGERQCDWWISGVAGDVEDLVRELRGTQSERLDLWSNDAEGQRIASINPV